VETSGVLTAVLRVAGGALMASRGAVDVAAVRAARDGGRRMKRSSATTSDQSPSFTYKAKDTRELVSRLRSLKIQVTAAVRRVEGAERIISELIDGVVPDDVTLGSEHETYYSTSEGEFTMTQIVVFCSKGDDSWRLRVRAPEPAEGEGSTAPQGIPLAKAGSLTLLHCAGDENKLESLVQAVLKDAVEVLLLAERVEEPPSPKLKRLALSN
jgi:hypothetical protein